MKETIIIEHTSTATVNFDESNRAMFLNALSTLDPDLWLIKNYLDRFNVSSHSLLTYIEHLGRINENSGRGRIVTEIKEGKIVYCGGTDSRVLDIDITRDYNIDVYTSEVSTP